MKNSKLQLLKKNENDVALKQVNNNFKENFYLINIFNIFNSSLNKEHVLCVGQVQSGKTKNIEKILEYGIKNGYKFIIIFSGITKILYKQTTERLIKNIENFKNIKFFDNLKKLKEIDFDNDNKVILSILKWHTELKNLYNSINAIDWRHEKVIIVDDECDYASLNNFNGYNNSSTFELVYNLYNRFHNVKLISFTGTPFANIVSSSSQKLKPNRIVNLINYPEYCGINYFNKNSGIFYKSIEFNKKEISQNLITQSFLVWLVSTSCALIENKNFKSEFLVNIEIQNHTQEKIMKYIEKSVVAIFESFDLNKYISSILDVFKLPHYDFEILYEKIKFIIEKLKNDQAFVLLNSDNDVKSFESGKRQFCVIVGGFMISRGVTFENLTTEFFLNVPINKIAIDVLLQRCRWFGNRLLDGRNKFLRIITNQSVIDALKKAEEYVNIFVPGICTTNIDEIYSKIISLDKKNIDVESTNATKRK